MAQYKGVQLKGSKASFMQSFGNAISEDDTTETITALLALADTIDLIRIAGGTRLQTLQTFNADLCTSGTLDVKIGYRKCNSSDTLNVAEDDDYFGASLTNFRAAVLSSAPTRYAFAPITFNCDVFITLTVTTAATGTAITTGTITTLATGKAVGIK
jgi:hypothetical protein